MSDKLNNKRQEGLVIINVDMSNPNGDPNAANAPRTLPDGRGYITPPCIKAKMRYALSDHTSPLFDEIVNDLKIKNPDGFCISESSQRGFGNVSATEAVDMLRKLNNDQIIAKFWDVRTFGSTLLEQKGDKKNTISFKRTGGVIIEDAVSVAPIQIIEKAIARRFPLEAKKLVSGDGTFGSTSVVKHGLYVYHYTINPHEGHKTKMTDADIEMLKKLIVVSFGLSQSASRTNCKVISAVHVVHPSVLSNDVESNAFIRNGTPKLKSNIAIPNSIDDYTFASDAEIKACFSRAEVQRLI